MRQWCCRPPGIFHSAGPDIGYNEQMANAMIEYSKKNAAFGELMTAYHDAIFVHEENRGTIAMLEARSALVNAIRALNEYIITEQLAAEFPCWSAWAAAVKDEW